MDGEAPSGVTGQKGESLRESYNGEIPAGFSLGNQCNLTEETWSE